MSKRGRIKSTQLATPSVGLPSKENDTPLFCFKHLRIDLLKKCDDAKFRVGFLGRLSMLGQLGWKQIRQDKRHGYGLEKIPREKIKPDLPVSFTQDVKELHVFRASGDNRVFIGLQVEHVFQVVFIEPSFGDVYDHD